MSIQLKGSDDSVYSNDIVAPNIPTQGQIVGYQQGVWIPTPSLGSITTFETSWVRIGNQVTVSANLRGFTDTTSNSVIALTGIPYARNFLFTVGAIRTAYLNFGEGSYVQVTLNSGDALRVGKSTPSLGGTSALVGEYVNYISFISAQQSSTQLVFTITYITDDTTWTPINGATVL